MWGVGRGEARVARAGMQGRANQRPRVVAPPSPSPSLGDGRRLTHARAHAAQHTKPKPKPHACTCMPAAAHPAPPDVAPEGGHAEEEPLLGTEAGQLALGLGVARQREELLHHHGLRQGGAGVAHTSGGCTGLAAGLCVASVWQVPGSAQRPGPGTARQHRRTHMYATSRCTAAPASSPPPPKSTQCVDIAAPHTHTHTLTHTRHTHTHYPPPAKKPPAKSQPATRLDAQHHEHQGHVPRPDDGEEGGDEDDGRDEAGAEGAVLGGRGLRRKGRAHDTRPMVGGQLAARGRVGGEAAAAQGGRQHAAAAASPGCQTWGREGREKAVGAWPRRWQHRQAAATACQAPGSCAASHLVDQQRFLPVEPTS